MRSRGNARPCGFWPHMEILHIDLRALGACPCTMPASGGYLDVDAC